MKPKWLNTMLVWLLFSVGVVITIGFDGDNRLPFVRGLLAQPITLRAAAQAGAAQLAGDYSGEVQLQFTAVGVYSDTLAAPPSESPDLGTIDLALNLSQNGSAISGYVSLAETLVFTKEHTIQDDGTTVNIGPYVNGSFDGTNLTLVSEQVANTLNGQPIKRQFRLSGAISAGDGSRISGEYRETLWGATRQPLTVLGAFTLQRTVYATGAPETSNQAPVTAADSVTTAQGTPITINVLANDTDANGDPLTITGVSRPQFGTATTDGQKVTYTPNVGFAGQDSFSYFVSDGHDNTAAGSVTITVYGPGGPPLSNRVYLPLVRK